MARHSSAVVRINVTFGLWRYRRRPRNFSGTVSKAPKLAMSSAPSEPTQGSAWRAKTSSRVGPAERMPPATSSAISVVETSMTPSRSPESASFSMDCPPTPVAWKTRQSQSSASCWVTCCTQGVVTPNIVSPIAGFVAWAPATGCVIMPASACAAFASTRSLMRLMPCTSVTEYIMQISLGPT